MQLWGLTDPGNLREQNQDSYAMLSFSRDRSLMIVCDGMGGAKSGNVASSLAVDVFTDEVRRCQKSGLTPERAAEILRGALELANKAVYEQAQLSDDFSGMGTTLVAALILKDTAVIINVGDSRAYLFTPDGVQLLTIDHSIVEFMVQRGLRPLRHGEAAPALPSIPPRPTCRSPRRALRRHPHQQHSRAHPALRRAQRGRRR